MVIAGHIKGSHVFVRHTGRDTAFSPFNNNVATSLRTRRAVDVVYDVNHRHSSREHRPHTPTLGKAARTASTRLPATTPDSGSYDPLCAFHAVEAHGKIGPSIGTIGRDCTSPVASVTPSPAEIQTQPRPAWGCDSTQTRHAPDKRVRGFCFSKSSTSKSGRSLRENMVSPDERTDYASTVHTPVAKPDRPAKRGWRWANQTPHSEGRGPGGISSAPRDTMGKYNWLLSSFPGAAGGAERGAGKKVKKHIPGISMTRESGRERRNPAKKDNQRELDRLIKRVNCAQHADDKRACYEDAVVSSFDRSAKGHCVPDLWLSGARMEMAVQGVTGMRTHPGDVARWLRKEAASVVRMPEKRERSRAKKGGGGGGGEGVIQGGVPAAEPSSSSATFDVGLKAEQRKIAIERLAEQEFQDSLRNVGFHNVGVGEVPQMAAVSP